jgi:hypothetical protein
VLRQDVYGKSGVWDVENVSLPYAFLLCFLFLLPPGIQTRLQAASGKGWPSDQCLLGCFFTGSDVATSVRLPHSEGVRTGRRGEARLAWL